MADAAYKLTITVHFDTNGCPKDELKELLSKIPIYAANNGMMSGDTEATVDDWTWRIDELP